MMEKQQRELEKEKEQVEKRLLNLARCALRMRPFVEKRNLSVDHEWRCRIAIGTGPVIGSIVGIHKYVYDVFGPPVNFSSRLEGLCEPMQILGCPRTAERLEKDFVLRSLGPTEIRGFGVQEILEVEAEISGRVWPRGIGRASDRGSLPSSRRFRYKAST